MHCQKRPNTCPTLDSTSGWWLFALRKALAGFYPEVEEIQLHDYKVRVLGSTEGTAS